MSFILPSRTEVAEGLQPSSGGPSCVQSHRKSQSSMLLSIAIDSTDNGNICSDGTTPASVRAALHADIDALADDELLPVREALHLRRFLRRAPPPETAG